MTFREFKALIQAGDIDEVSAALDARPDLLHTCDPDESQWEEYSALHCAARYAHLDIVRLLIDRGAEVYTNPLRTYPAVFIANRHQHYADRPNADHIVEYLLNEIPDKADGTHGLGATIHIAAREGWTEIVRQHVEIDPLAVHQRGLLGDSPLHWPAHNGHAEIVNLLVKAGADLEADELGCYGGKPLHWASEHETETARILLQHGAKVNSLNVRRQSEFYGVTPLLMNVLMKDDCSEVTELLLQAGGNPTLTFNGKSMVEIARERGNMKILGALQQARGS